MSIIITITTTTSTATTTTTTTAAAAATTTTATAATQATKSSTATSSWRTSCTREFRDIRNCMVFEYVVFEDVYMFEDEDVVYGV